MHTCPVLSAMVQLYLRFEVKHYSLISFVDYAGGLDQFSSESSRRVRGVFGSHLFMTYFYRAGKGGNGPLGPLRGSATAIPVKVPYF